MMFRFLITTIVSIILVSCGSEELSLYVSPDGSDSNDGSLSAPVETLIKAQQIVQRALKAGHKGDIKVILRGGTYRLTETLVIGLEDQPVRDRTVSYEAYPGEEPILTSTVKLSGWKRPKELPAGLSTVAHKNIWVTEAPTVDGEYLDFKVLFDGEQMQPRARSKGFQPTDACPEPTLANRWEDLTTLNFPDGVIKDWPNLQDVEVFIRPTHQWLVNYLPLASVDESSLTATTTIPGTYRLSQVKNKPWKETAWVENVLEALDEPGEWVLNTTDGKIYIWPRGAEPGDNIQVPLLHTLVRVEGKNTDAVEGDIPVRGIAFRGITFTGADRDVWSIEDKGIQHDWDMYDKDNTLLRFRGAEDCIVENCEFRNSGSGGIRADLYAQRISITSSTLNNLGGTAILLSGYGPGIKDVNKGHLIQNNEIHHIGQLYLHSPAFFVWQSGENKILNNYVHHLPYDAVVLSGVRPRYFGIMDPVKWTGYAIPRTIRENMQVIRWDEVGDPQTAEEALKFAHARNNLVQDNEFHNVMEVLGDGNAIYLSCAGKGNVIRRNLVYKSTQSANEIRFDDDQEESTVEQNIVFGSGIKLKHTNYILNNVIIGGGISIRPETAVGAQVHHNIIYATDKVRFYSTNVAKKLQGLLDLANPDKNLFYAADIDAGLVDFENIQGLGHEANGRFTDPMFVDLAGGDIRLQPNSPALEMGIESIDIEKIGLLDDPAWQRIQRENISVYSDGPVSHDRPSATMQLLK